MKYGHGLIGIDTCCFLYVISPLHHPLDASVLNNVRCYRGLFLAIQWLRLQAPTAGNPGLIPSQATRSHMLQLRICIPQLKRSQVLQLRPTATKREDVTKECPSFKKTELRGTKCDSQSEFSLLICPLL